MLLSLSRIHPRARGRRLALICHLSIALAGCTHWAGQDLPADRLLQAKHPDRIRVARVAGERTVMIAPRVAGDSLLGMIENDGSRTRGAIALADIRQVEIRRVNVVATAALAAGAGVTAAVIAAAAAGGGTSNGSGSGGGNSCDYCTSCPLVYSWDGAHWRLDSGTFGGAVVHALQRTDVDNLDFATAQVGSVRLDVRNELSETDYIDRLAVLAVDHDSAVDVAPDPDGNLHALGRLLEPTRANDDRGQDILARVRQTDGWEWESAPRPRDPADSTDLLDGIELAFPRPIGATAARLVVDAHNTPWAAYLLAQFVRAHGAGTEAWYDSLDAHADDARRFGMRLAREAFLQAAIRTSAGWRPAGLFWEAGPEVVKRQVLVLDLTGVSGDSVYVRLQAPPSFWLIDRVALDVGAEQPLAARELQLASARDRHGRDVRPAIAAIDGSYLALETGEGAELRFQDAAPIAGKRRTYLLRSTGWYRLQTPNTGAGDPAFLAQVSTDARGVSRSSVERMNQALLAMASGSW
jgi:hypothetical protein